MQKIVKKITILNTDLPVIHADGNHLIRYRVVSKDGSKISAWSTPQVINVPLTLSNGITTSSGSITSDNVGITVGWDITTLNIKSSFDVFVRWSYDTGITYDTDFYYVATVNANTHYILIPKNSLGVSATNVNVRIQQSTNLKSVYSNSISGGTTLADNVLVYSGISSTVAVVQGFPTSFDGS